MTQRDLSQVIYDTTKECVGMSLIGVSLISNGTLHLRFSKRKNGVVHKTIIIDLSPKVEVADG